MSSPRTIIVILNSCLRVFARSTIALVVASLALPAVAQDTVTGEILVTARKRSENLFDVPVAITALSAQAIEQRGIINLVDIANFSPGFSFENSAVGRSDRSFVLPVIRGMDPGTFVSTRQAVQILLDGIAISGGNTPGLTDIERVEVIKGPQAAYFGRSTFSGAVNFITRDPDYEWSGRVTAQVDHKGGNEQTLSIEGPIVQEKVAFRVSLRNYNAVGDYRNAFDGQRLGDQSTRSVSGTLFAEPTDRLTMKAYVSYWRDDDGPTSEALTDIREKNCNPGVAGVVGNTWTCGRIPMLPESRIGRNFIVDQRFKDGLLSASSGLPKFRENAFIDHPGLERRALQVTGSVSYELGRGIVLDANGAYHKNDFEVLQDLDNTDTSGIPNPLFGIVPGARSFTNTMFLVQQGDSNKSAEFRISSPDDQRLSWVVGFSYFSQFAGGNVSGEFPFGFLSLPTTHTRGTALGAFGGLTLDLTDRLSISAEGRYQRDKIESQVVKPFVGPRLEDTFESIQPRFIGKWDITDDVNVYASWSSARRPGDFNANLAAATPAIQAEVVRQTGARVAVDEEKLSMYEVGVKGQFWDGRAQAALALYYGKWTNQHISTVAKIGSILGGNIQDFNVVSAIGKTKLKGIELEGTLLLSDNFTLDGNFAIADSKIGSEYICQICLEFSGSTDVSGNRLPRSSKYQGTLSGTYRSQLNEVFDWFVRADYLYNGTIYATVANLADTGDAHRVNLRIGFESESLRIELYGTNILNDKSYRLATQIPNFIDPSPGRSIQMVMPDKPRAGIRASYKF